MKRNVCEVGHHPVRLSSVHVQRDDEVGNLQALSNLLRLRSFLDRVVLALREAGKQSQESEGWLADGNFDVLRVGLAPEQLEPIAPYVIPLCGEAPGQPLGQ